MLEEGLTRLHQDGPRNNREKQKRSSKDCRREAVASSTGASMSETPVEAPLVSGHGRSSGDDIQWWRAADHDGIHQQGKSTSKREGKRLLEDRRYTLMLLTGSGKSEEARRRRAQVGMC